MECTNNTVDSKSSQKNHDLKSKSADGACTSNSSWVGGQNSKVDVFREGQHVWAIVGKEKHAAVIVSIPSRQAKRCDIVSGSSLQARMVKVQWSSLGSGHDWVETDTIMPMFDEKDGKCTPSVFSKRNRKRTDYYKPPSSESKPIIDCKVDSIKKRRQLIKSKREVTMAPVKGEWSKIGRISIDRKADVSTKNEVCMKTKVRSKLQKRTNHGRPKTRITSEGDVVSSLRQSDSEEARASFLRIGQRVWVFLEKRKHAAVIVSFSSTPFADQNENDCVYNSKMVKVRYFSVGSGHEWVAISKILPMFEDENSNYIPSTFGKRSKKKTDFYTPPMPKVKSEDDDNISESCNLKSNYVSKTIALKSEDAPGERGPQKKSATENQMKSSKTREKNPSERKSPPEKSSIAVKKDSDTTPCQLSRSGTNEIEEENVSDMARNYEALWNYYLKPRIRKNEELPGGMVLRKKVAQCNLLRYKNSKFRHRLYSKIQRLERLGRKTEIYRTLREIYDHDLRGQSGDGPENLIREIMEENSAGDNEIAVVGLPENNLKKEWDTIDVEKEAPICQSMPCNKTSNENGFIDMSDKKKQVWNDTEAAFSDNKKCLAVDSALSKTKHVAKLSPTSENSLDGRILCSKKGFSEAVGSGDHVFGIQRQCVRKGPPIGSEREDKTNDKNNATSLGQASNDNNSSSISLKSDDPNEREKRVKRMESGELHSNYKNTSSMTCPGERAIIDLVKDEPKHQTTSNFETKSNKYPTCRPGTIIDLVVSEPDCELFPASSGKKRKDQNEVVNLVEDTDAGNPNVSKSPEIIVID